MTHRAPGEAGFLKSVHAWLGHPSSVSVSGAASSAEDFHVAWAPDQGLLVVTLVHAGRAGRVFLSRWEDGIRWACDFRGEPEIMPPDLDPGLPVLDPAVAWASLWRAQIPAAVLQTLAHFTTARWALLHWSSRSREALELLGSAPKLLWLLLMTAQRDRWPESRIGECLRLKRRDILAACGLHQSNSTLKLLAKIQFPRYGRQAFAWLGYCLGDEQRVHSFRHYTSVNEAQLRFLASFPEYTPVPLVQQAPDDPDYFRELSRWLRDTRNMAEQLRADDVGPRLRRCKTQEGLQHIHDRLAQQLNSLGHRPSGVCELAGVFDFLAEQLDGGADGRLHPGELPDVAYGTPPVPGNDTIIPINHSRELVDEGQFQSNCLRTYHDRIRTGRYFAYRVLAPERATLGVILQQGSPPRIDQLATRCNGPVTPATRSAVQAWFNSALDSVYRSKPEVEQHVVGEHIPLAAPLRQRAALGHDDQGITALEARVSADDAPMIRVVPHKAFELGRDEPDCREAVLGLIAVGASGNRAVQAMQAHQVTGVDFIFIDPVTRSIDEHTGCSILRTASVPAVARPPEGSGKVSAESAVEARTTFGDWLAHGDMIIIVGELSSHTEAGVAKRIAEMSRLRDILTVVVAPQPFSFEGQGKYTIAWQGRAEVLPRVDTLITLPSDKMAASLGADWSPSRADAAVNKAVLNTVQSITDVITRPWLIGVDFSDVRTVLKNMGAARMGTGEGAGEHGARRAAEAVLASLLADCDLFRARGLLVNITGGLGLSLSAFDQCAYLIAEFHAGSACVVATVLDADLQRDQVRVTMLATGLER